jgi:WD40 repeat protein
MLTGTRQIVPTMETAETTNMSQAAGRPGFRRAEIILTLFSRIPSALLTAVVVTAFTGYQPMFSTFPGGQNYTSCLAVSADGRFVVAGSQDGTPRVWDADQLQFVQELGGIQNVNSAAFSPTGTAVALAGNDGTVRIYNMADWNESRILREKHPVEWVAYIQGGRVLVSAGWWGMQLWDTSNGTRLSLLPVPGHDITALAVSPTEDFVAIGNTDGEIYLRKVNVDREPQALSCRARYIKALAFSPNGRKLASGDEDGNIRLWDTTTRKESATWSAHKVSVLALAFTNDNFLVSSGVDARIRIWDTIKRQVCFECRADPNSQFSVYWMAASPAKKRLVLCSGPGYIMLFRPPCNIWTTADAKP